MPRKGTGCRLNVNFRLRAHEVVAVDAARAIYRESRSVFIRRAVLAATRCELEHAPTVPPDAEHSHDE